MPPGKYPAKILIIFNFTQIDAYEMDMILFLKISIIFYSRKIKVHKN